VEPALTTARRIRLLIEAGVVYGVAPVLLWSGVIPMRALHPLMLAGTVVTFVILLRDPSFKTGQLANLSGFVARLPLLLRLFALCVPLVAGLLAVMLYAKSQGLIAVPPQVDWLWLWRNKPDIYIMVMIGYPVLSVYPQEVIYRALFFHRYAPAFGPIPAAIAANALLFGFGHIIFHNPVAVGLTVIGGVIFSVTYMRTKSLVAAAFEHALYGCLLFTLGLGWYFFGGSVQAMEKLTGN
jgi:membrane protease YdiL (CAAX protease family)